MGTPSNPKQTILETIKTKFEAISAVGGNYFYTYSGKVYLNKQTAFESLGINISDANENKLEEDSSGTLWDNDLDVDVDIVCTTAAEMANLYKYEADIMKCIGANLTWDALAFHTDFINSIRNKADQEGRKVADQTIRIRITFRKNAWNN